VSSILEISGLTRCFGGLTAVDSINMRVGVGDVRGLIGPNGAGKTTLLNLVGGQLRATSGRIVFDGADIGRLTVDRRAALGIRRTFQNLKLFREMTVLENVTVGLHANTRAQILEAILRTSRQRKEERWIADKAMQALQTVRLRDAAHMPASSLAYGHRRLLEIARALASQPRVLLLDEPAAGLNRTEAGELVALIRRIAAGGVTIVLVEHHMDVVMTVCGRITVLNYGRLLAEGSPREVQKHPDVIEAYLGRGAKPVEAAHA
jgi:branched-chain amino acid transport system ATP-binding protein